MMKLQVPHKLLVLKEQLFCVCVCVCVCVTNPPNSFMVLRWPGSTLHWIVSGYLGTMALATTAVCRIWLLQGKSSTKYEN